MPLLPDLGAAALYALVVFLAALGLLVVFIEAIRPGRMLALLAADVALAALLIWATEVGVAFLVLAAGFALLGNQAFERLTTR